jgi:hypothetical protein
MINIGFKMNESQYYALCKYCDELLLANPTSSARLSVAWLHVIREHPTLLRPYEQLFQQRSIKKYSAYWWKIKKILIESTRILRQAIRAFRYTLLNQDSVLTKLGTSEIIFISHFTNSAQHKSNSDFYFGDLPNQIASRGKKVAIVLIDHTQSSSSLFRWTTSEQGVLKIIIPNTLGPREEIDILFKLWQESRHLARIAEGKTEDLFTKIKAAASSAALSNGSFQTLRLALQIGEIVKRLRPNTLITTYEGHAWERAAYVEARRHAPLIRCAAYQHAALTRLQHGVQRSLGAIADPDIIFTSGLAASGQLNSSDRIQIAPIQVLGSSRKVSANYLTERSTFCLRRQAPVCLVIPEGLIDECLTTLVYTIKCAALLPNVTFLWRMHPVLSFDSLLQHHPILDKLPNNIELSIESLSVDAARSSWALYRGSTAVIEATLLGAAPIYLRTNSEMTIDPLYKLNKERAIVETVEDFVSLLKRDKYPTWDQFDASYRHCLEVFSPSKPKVLMDYIDKIHSESHAGGT